MRRALLVVGLVVVAGLFPAQTATAASIGFQSKNITLGACPTPDCSFSVDILGEDFEPFIGLVLNFSFDSTVVALTSIDQGPFLSSGGSAGFDSTPLPDATFQTITKLVDLSAPAIVGSGVLATLNFTPTPSALGNIGLLLLVSGITNDRVVNTEYFTEDGQVLAPAVGRGDIIIQNATPVPEPSTLALLGVGLAAMARKKLKRKTLG